METSKLELGLTWLVTVTSLEQPSITQANLLRAPAVYAIDVVTPRLTVTGARQSQQNCHGLQIRF